MTRNFGLNKKPSDLAWVWQSMVVVGCAIVFVGIMALYEISTIHFYP